jgi:DNA-directed RNA polymerase subunit RPC12/RpoP
MEVKLKTYKCKRCGHVWIPRKEEKPKSCPSCKNRLWDEDRVGDHPATSWQKYEVEKQALIKLNLPYQEYEAEIARIAKELGV